MKRVPEALYLHTIIDMGEKGTLSPRQIAPAVEYVHTCGYEVSGNILGEILVKCHENSAWHRYMEVKIPIKI